MPTAADPASAAGVRDLRWRDRPPRRSRARGAHTLGAPHPPRAPASPGEIHRWEISLAEALRTSAQIALASGCEPPRRSTIPNPRNAGHSAPGSPLPVVQGEWRSVRESAGSVSMGSNKGLRAATTAERAAPLSVPGDGPARTDRYRGGRGSAPERSPPHARAELELFLP